MIYFANVLIADPINIESHVEAALKPFDGVLEVAPYRAHLSQQEVKCMADHYHLDSTNLKDLAEKLLDWSGFEGGVDSQGLFYHSTLNPRGYWDWYQIGGWNGAISGAVQSAIKAGKLAQSGELKCSLPHVIVTPDSEWLDHQNAANEYAETESVNEDRTNVWLSQVRNIFKQWPEEYVVGVDLHC